MSEDATGTAAHGARGGPPCLIVVAHPDDEVIGCGALMARLADVDFVQVTRGAPTRTRHYSNQGFATPEAFGEARWGETLAGLALIGADRTRCHNLGLEDQRTAFSLAELARALVPFVRSADVVYTHAYEGGHPDHDATAFAVHAARRMSARMARTARTTLPQIYEMPFYRAGIEGWVRQSFMPTAGAGPVHVARMTPGELMIKLAMRDCHRTQARTLAHFDLGRERFRRAPDHDFTRRAGDLPPLYPRYGGLSEREWFALVEAASDDLGFEPALGREHQLLLI